MEKDLVDVRPASGGASLTVRVRPRSRPAIAIGPDGVTVSVAGAPVEGRATEEARRLLADILGVAGSAVILRRGARSRTKVFTVRGLDPSEVSRRLRGGTGR